MTRRMVALITGLVVTTVAPAIVRAQEPTPQPPAQERPQEPARPEPDDAENTDPDAQEPEDTDAPPRRTSAVRFRVSGLVGFQSFSAKNSFDAVLGSSSGPVFGGGAGLLVGRHAFVDVQVSRFSADGSRVFITDDGTVFDLEIPTTVTVVPIDISAGWRFTGTPRPGRNGKPRLRPVPYVGGGIGLQIYRETSEFADAGDDVDESNGSYHVLGGIELPFTRGLGANVDVLYRWVPDAIGSAGVSSYFDESDLGGAQVRFRISYTF